MRTGARVLRAIAKYGERYFEELLIARYDPDKLRTDWWAGLRFWFDRAFYQGRRDAVSERIENRAVNALEEVVGEDGSKRAYALRELAAGGWLQPENWEAGGNPVQVALVRHQVNKRYDRLMVLGTLALCAEVNHLNIVLWAVETIQRGAVDAAFKRWMTFLPLGQRLPASS